MRRRRKRRWRGDGNSGIGEAEEDGAFVHSRISFILNRHCAASIGRHRHAPSCTFGSIFCMPQRRKGDLADSCRTMGTLEALALPRQCQAVA